MMSVISRLGAVGFAAAVAIPSSAASAQGADTALYRYVVALDTIATERVIRTTTTLSGDLRLRGQPRVLWTQFTAEPASVSTLRMQVWMPGAADSAAPAQDLVLRIRGDSAFVYRLSGGIASAPSADERGTPQTVLRARDGATWLVNASLIHGAWIAQRARSLQHDTAWVVLSAGGQLLPAPLTWSRTQSDSQGGDTLAMTIAGVQSRYLMRSDGMLASATVPAQRLAVVRAASGVMPVRAVPPAPSYDAPRDAPYVAEHVTIPTSEGHTLAATLTRPRSARAVPVAITISGSGAQERDEAIPGVEGYRPFREIADTLGRRGIAVLRFDDRGTGASSGVHATATSRDFAHDVQAIIGYLRGRSDIDGRRIALVGHSEGGLIAPLVASTDSSLAAIALLAGPAYTGARIIAFQQREGVAVAHPNADSSTRDLLFRAAQKQLDSVRVVNPWIREFLVYDPLPTARAVRTPVLILQGETDRQVTPEQADTLAHAFRSGGNRDLTVRRLANTNHLFQRDRSGGPGGYGTLPNRAVTKETLGLLADWLAHQLRPTP